ncbi:GDSL esterase/lipase At4g10955 [Dendrobium catenatum]|uniref:GDSL esterase/lipase n=1 Tax=Dendrobium catenatum TaxID=906689 RepID=A0A2I0W402_9ASPA|nr:GDSL esterase/lipase At4g10955 [Dendrobium catenatum]PKU70368.1 GDSL esterase/lipase [Dendrobium catenatum]
MQEMLKRRQDEAEVECSVSLMAWSSSAKENDGGGTGGGGAGDEGTKKIENSEVEEHPYDFHVSGPRNLSSPNWKDLIRSSWRDPNYKRMVIACFIQAVYLLELDRQEKRTEENGLAPKWWKPFKYKVTQTLIDDRDGSIYGAILEWDRYAAFSEFIVVRPSGAPRAVLALRGTILKSPTIRRDLEDDLRFLAWESLKGSVRFAGALAALRSAVDRFGSSNVSVGGHSLGAGFALQVGKALAKEGVFVECHLFNPPSVSLAMSLKSVGEMAVSIWSRVRAALPTRSAGEGGLIEKNAEARAVKIQCTEISKWVPHLYVNNSDYICCYYSDPSGPEIARDGGGLGKAGASGGAATTAKLFVMSNGPKKFLEAHGLQQWWSDDMELKLALNHSNLINRQLRSLYAVPVAAAKMR